VIYQHACTLGCEGNVSKRLGSPYRAGRTDQWLKMKNPKAPAVRREREIDWANRLPAALGASSYLAARLAPSYLVGRASGFIRPAAKRSARCAKSLSSRFHFSALSC